MIAKCFKEQKAFVLDRSRRKSALCPRRSGKSYSSLVLMGRTGLLKPNAVIRYICLTKGQAKDNLWALLKSFNQEFELNLKFHETNLIATFPNGSHIKFVGAETRSECEKLRGQSFDLAVLDEAKSFQPDILEEFIEEVLAPTLTDRRGVLAMIGTPGNVLAGPFYEATSEYDPTDKLDLIAKRQRPRPWAERELYKHNNKWKWNWSFHRWHTKNNVAMPHVWLDALEQKDNRGIPDNDPSWLREWMGQWCPSDSLMVYSFTEKLNTYDGTLPEGHDWQYLLGLDFGYNDSTAIVVAAFSDTHHEMFQVYEYKEPELTVDQIERQILKVQKIYPEINAIIADTGGLGKTIVESYRERGIAMEAAVKTDKLDHIELVNSDLLAGNIKLLPDSRLAAEMKLLQWTDKTYRKENKGTDNHCCDAFLYLIRHAYHHFWEPARVEVTAGSAEAYKLMEEAEMESMLSQHSRINQQADNLSNLDTSDLTGLDGDYNRWNQ